VWRSNREKTILVLKRNLGERIFIDGGIIITIVGIDRGQVRIGIEAPKHVNIQREEIMHRPRKPDDDFEFDASGIPDMPGPT